MSEVKILLTETILKILKNFATINNSMVFFEGNVLRSLAPSNSIIAKAIVPVNFPFDFAIYDLKQFLSLLDMFRGDDLYINFDESRKFINIVSFKTGMSSEVVYWLTDLKNVKSPPKKDVEMKIDSTFPVSFKTLENITKAGVLTKSELIEFTTKDDEIVVQTKQSNKNSHSYSEVIMKNYTGEPFSVSINLENVLLYPIDYQFEIDLKGVVHLKSKDEKINVEYWIASIKKKE